MSFMQPEIFTGKVTSYTYNGNTYLIPAEFFQPEKGIKNVQTFVGCIGRMSAPGYLDATDWEQFDSPEEAEEQLREMYGDDDWISDDDNPAFL